MTRIALITQAAPWEQNQLVGLYNWHQAAALKRNGAEMEVFVPVASMPRVLERFSAGLRRVNARPASYEFRNVRFHSFKSYIPHPSVARRTIGRRAPRLLGRWNAMLAPRIADAMQTFKPHVVMVHDALLMGDLGRRVASRVGAAYAVIEHETIDFPPQSRRGRYYRDITRTAEAVFTAHQPSLDHMREKLGMTNGKLLLNGSVIASEQQLHTPRPTKWDGKKVVLCVGAFDAAKGHVELVKAFAAANIDQSVLVIVASSQPPAPLLEAIEQSGVKERVEFIAAMPQDELQQYMAWADLFALPSRWESFGLVFTEAMGARTPIICTSQCGIAAHITAGIHGWIVPPADHQVLVAALRDALLNADLDAMGKAGRALVEEKFTWDSHARQLLETLKDV